MVWNLIYLLLIKLCAKRGSGISLMKSMAIINMGIEMLFNISKLEYLECQIKKLTQRVAAIQVIKATIQLSPNVVLKNAKTAGVKIR